MVNTQMTRPFVLFIITGIRTTKSLVVLSKVLASLEARFLTVFLVCLGMGAHPLARTLLTVPRREISCTVNRVISKATRGDARTHVQADKHIPHTHYFVLSTRSGLTAADETSAIRSDCPPQVTEDGGSG